MNEALRVCEQLLHFSEEARAVFLGEDERAILRAIEARETIIDRLIGLEYRIDLVLDANDEYACGGALPEEAESARLKARDILGAVMGMDVRAMRHVRLKNAEIQGRDAQGEKQKASFRLHQGQCGALLPRQLRLYQIAVFPARRPPKQKGHVCRLYD
jgi:hypothetical protein